MFPKENKELKYLDFQINQRHNAQATTAEMAKII